MSAFRDQVALVAAQIGSSMQPDTQVWMNRFTVKSTSSNKTYLVSQRRSDGEWGCSCQGWTHHRHCKHLDNVLARLSNVQAKADYDAGVIELLNSARTAYLDLNDATPRRVLAPAAGPVLDLS